MPDQTAAQRIVSVPQQGVSKCHSHRAWNAPAVNNERLLNPTVAIFERKGHAERQEGVHVWEFKRVIALDQQQEQQQKGLSSAWTGCWPQSPPLPSPLLVRLKQCGI